MKGAWWARDGDRQAWQGACEEDPVESRTDPGAIGQEVATCP